MMMFIWTSTMWTKLETRARASASGTRKMHVRTMHSTKKAGEKAGWGSSRAPTAFFSCRVAAAAAGDWSCGNGSVGAGWCSSRLA